MRPGEARGRESAPAQGACDDRRGEGPSALDPPCRDDAVLNREAWRPGGRAARIDRPGGRADSNPG